LPTSFRLLSSGRAAALAPNQRTITTGPPPRREPSRRVGRHGQPASRTDSAHGAAQRWATVVVAGDEGPHPAEANHVAVASGTIHAPMAPSEAHRLGRWGRIDLAAVAHAGGLAPAADGADGRARLRTAEPCGSSEGRQESGGDGEHEDQRGTRGASPRMRRESDTTDSVITTMALLRWRFSGRSGHARRSAAVRGCGQVGGDSVVATAQILHERVRSSPGCPVNR
jgi:hypothetical protein